MRAAAKIVGERFWHETDDSADRLCYLFQHEAQKNKPVRHGQRCGVTEIETAVHLRDKALARFCRKSVCAAISSWLLDAAACVWVRHGFTAYRFGLKFLCAVICDRSGAVRKCRLAGWEVLCLPLSL